jgi:hypothetical protein
MALHQFNEMSISQFINSSIKRLSPSAPILLAVVLLVAGAPRLDRAYVLAGLPFTLTPVSLSAGAVGRPIRVGSTAW